METLKNIRKAGNRGAFYPYTCEEIERFITLFNRSTDELPNKKLLTIKPKAIIAPHAGYIYSGFTANAAHKTLANSQPQTIVVIGPSHHVFIDGISAGMAKYYETPCGDLETDIPLLEELDRKFSFDFNETAHYKEHSTETQMPFIAHYNPQARIIELIYGRTSYQEIAGIIEYILQKPETAVVISSDLSHFYDLAYAEKLDSLCLKAVQDQNMLLFDQGCEACGITGIKAITKVALDKKLHSGILDYRTSADASGDTQRVVGYMSAVFW